MASGEPQLETLGPLPQGVHAPAPRLTQAHHVGRRAAPLHHRLCNGGRHQCHQAPDQAVAMQQCPQTMAQDHGLMALPETACGEKNIAG